MRASQAADCLQSYPKCPALCNDFSRQLTGPGSLTSLHRFHLIIRLDTVADHIPLTLLQQLTREQRGIERFRLSPLFGGRGEILRPSLPALWLPLPLNLLFFLRPRIASTPNTISHHELQKRVNSPEDAMHSPAWFGTMLSPSCCFLTLIAFVIDG